MDYLGSMPKKGFSRGELEGMDHLSGAELNDRYLKKVSACHGCVVACGRVFRLSKDSEEQKGPEYETMVGFGPNLGITDPVFITKMGEICDRAGIDTISASNTIGLAFRMFELGNLTINDTNGLELEWGNKEVAEVLLRKMINREGIGHTLALGARGFAKHFDVEELAVQVNGLEIAYHDPRAFSGMALVYATSPRGGCHNQSDYYLVEIGGAEEILGIKVRGRQEGAEKAENVILHQNWRTVFNALIVCIFGNVSPNKLVTLINAACNLDWTLDDLMLAGERAWNLKRVINNRLGLRRENDSLPKPLLEPLPDGGAAGYIIEFDSMLKAYYKFRDWNWETGFPKAEKLEELGLSFVIEDLDHLK